MGGDEAGVAFRALIAAATAPTAKAKTAMLANGLNYKNYQNSPDRIALDPFVADVAAKYGVKLDKDAQKGLGKIFSNKRILSDPALFAPAVMKFLKGSLGGNDAKSLKSIAGEANRYRDASMKNPDVNKLIVDLMSKLANNIPSPTRCSARSREAELPQRSAIQPPSITWSTRSPTIRRGSRSRFQTNAWRGLMVP